MIILAGGEFYPRESHYFFVSCLPEEISHVVSYPNNALPQHYATNHHNAKAKFEVNIIDQKQNNITRKLSEALYIHRNKPELNEKSELEHIVKYMSK